MAFAKNVFMNCPFDDDYVPLLRPMLFVVLSLRFEPLIASARLDSGTPRLQKIMDLIGQAKYGIHDLSRIRASKAGEYFRLNMPFELGVDVGCRIWGKGGHTRKRCLILEAEKYRFHAAISDLSNSDIGVHGNEPAELVRQVRNWLADEAAAGAPAAAVLWGRFNEFMAAQYDRWIRSGFSRAEIQAMPIGEMLKAMRAWIASNPMKEARPTRRKRTRGRGSMVRSARRDRARRRGRA